MRKKAIIITTGDEILEGLTLNTNQQYMSRRLNDIGIEVMMAVSLPDNIDLISKALKGSLELADFIIVSGGLGPTEDDLTREAVAEALGKRLRMDSNMLEKLENRVKERSMKFPSNIKKQAMLIEGATFLENSIGSAPGQVINHNGKTIFLLPGPPMELKPMFENYVLSMIRSKIKSDITVKIYRFSGIPEALLEETIAEIVYNKGIKVSTTLDGFIGPTIRLTYSKKDSKIIEGIEKQMMEKVGKYLYSIGDKKLDEIVIERLLRESITISTAESCTGGLLASKIVNYPGVSVIYKGGVVCYSNESKVSLLNVNVEDLKKYGAVSRQIVSQMAENVAKKFSADIGVGVSGIAGPAGGTPEKPVGLVYIGVFFKGSVHVIEKKYSGDRNSVRQRAVYGVFDMLRKLLI